MTRTTGSPDQPGNRVESPSPMTPTHGRHRSPCPTASPGPPPTTPPSEPTASPSPTAAPRSARSTTATPPTARSAPSPAAWPAAACPPPSPATATTPTTNSPAGRRRLQLRRDGNLLSDGTNTYTWNAGRARLDQGGHHGVLQLQPVRPQANRDRERHHDVVPLRRTAWDSNVVQEQSGTAPTSNLLTGGLDQVFQLTTPSGTNSSFLTDQLGSTIALANSAGQVTTSYTYDPSGSVTASGAASPNTFDFAGTQNDGTGLYAHGRPLLRPQPPARSSARTPPASTAAPATSIATPMTIPLTKMIPPEPPAGLCIQTRSLKTMQFSGLSWARVSGSWPVWQYWPSCLKRSLVLSSWLAKSLVPGPFPC